MAESNRTPAIPQCCVDHRLAVLDAVEILFFNDTLASFDRLRDHEDGCGWPPSDAIDALREGYRPWIVDRVGGAIDLAISYLEQVAA